MQKGMIKSLKAINFDLDSKALQKIYQSDNPFIYLKAYKQINKFFTDNGFVHRQWSGYISKGKLFDYEIINLIDDIKENGTKGKAPISRKQIKNNAKIISQKNTVSKEKQTDKSR